VSDQGQAFCAGCAADDAIGGIVGVVVRKRYAEGTDFGSNWTYSNLFEEDLN
jgi:hypothetical protein